MNKKINAIAKNDYVVAVVCKILGVLLTILYSALSARYLGAALKGEVAYMSGYATIISIILTVGVHQAYPYYRKQSGNADIKNAFMNSVLFMIFVYYVICGLLSLFFADNQSIMVIMLLSPILAYSRISGYVYLVEAPTKRNVLYLIIEVVQIVYVLFLFLFLKRNLIIGISVMCFVDVVLSICYTSKMKIKISIKNIDLVFLKKLIAYGYRIDVLMLKEFENVNFAQIGVYSIGVTLAEKVLLIPEAVKDILLSKLAKGAEDETVAKVMRLCMPICLFTFIGILVLGQPFINILYGSEFKNAYSVTVITMFGVIAIMFYKMITVYNIVNKKQNFNLVVLLSSIAINVVMNILLIPKMNIIGAAIATVISYVYCAIVFLIYFSRRTKIKMCDLILINKSDVMLLKGFIHKKRS